jgi:hypothetical protein
MGKCWGALVCFPATILMGLVDSSPVPTACVLRRFWIEWYELQCKTPACRRELARLASQTRCHIRRDGKVRFYDEAFHNTATLGRDRFGNVVVEQEPPQGSYLERLLTDAPLYSMWMGHPFVTVPLHDWILQGVQDYEAEVGFL